jgi:hypothetical protein
MTFHSGYAIAIYIAGCALVSLFAASRMRDDTGRDIGREYSATLVPAAR